MRATGLRTLGRRSAYGREGLYGILVGQKGFELFGALKRGMGIHAGDQVDFYAEDMLPAQLIGKCKRLIILAIWNPNAILKILRSRLNEMLKKFRRDAAARRLLEEKLFEYVALEIQRGIRRQGLWAKALAQSDGSEERAKSSYIRLRVQSLKDEAKIEEAIGEMMESLMASDNPVVEAEGGRKTELEEELEEEVLKNEEYRKLVESKFRQKLKAAKKQNISHESKRIALEISPRPKADIVAKAIGKLMDEGLECEVIGSSLMVTDPSGVKTKLKDFESVLKHALHSK